MLFVNGNAVLSPTQQVATRRLGAGRKRPVMFVTLGDRHWKPTPEGLGADEQCYPIARALAAAGYRHLCFIDTQGVADATLRQRDGDLAGGTVRWQRFSGFCASGLGYFFANWMRLDYLRRTAMTDPAFNRHLTYCGVQPGAGAGGYTARDLSRHRLRGTRVFSSRRHDWFARRTRPPSS